VLVLSSSSSQHDYMAKGQHDFMAKGRIIVTLVLSFLTVEKMIHVLTCIHHLLLIVYEVDINFFFVSELLVTVM